MMFARTFRWVIVTPLGSAVAPEVKMISARVTAVSSETGRRGSGVRAVPRFRGSERRADGLARASTPAPSTSAGAATSSPTRIAFASTIAAMRASRSADARKSTGTSDDAREETAPERDDPFGAVLGPDDDLVVRRRCRPHRRRAANAARGGGHLPVGRPAAPDSRRHGRGRDPSDEAKSSKKSRRVSRRIRAKMIQTDALWRTR